MLRYFFFALFLGIYANVFAQKYTISGTIKDKANGETLIGVAIGVKDTPQGTSTNEYGFFSLTLPTGNYVIVANSVGYKKQEFTIQLTQNQILDVEMESEAFEIEEVTLVGKEDEPDRNVRSTEMSMNKLEMKTIQKVPALLGEVDVMRTLQTMPGVSTVGEGSQGFNVRGGGIDQNLILLDEAVVFNSSHLLGFFSVFNPDAVKDVKLIKGGIPSQYGGRLSSILDIRMKEGNNKRFAGTGGVGTVSSRLTLEAPIVKDKGSFVLAGRRSYADLFLKLSSNENLRNNILYFYDLSAKANYTLGKKDRIFLSGYFGRDYFRFGKEFNFNWGNGTGTLRWNHIFNDKLFMNLTAVYSDYKYGLGIPEGSQGFDWQSQIKSYSPKLDFNYYISPAHTLNFGTQLIHYDIQPGRVKPLGTSIFNEIKLDNKRALESSAYVSHIWNPNARLSFEYGIRFSTFTLLGGGKYYDYVGELGERKTRGKEYSFGKNATVASYPNFEPRAALRYSLDETSSIKLSYNRMAQYIHLISNTTAATPTDVWTPSTRNIKPEIAHQVAGGYFKNLKDNTIEISGEIYYKTMSNQIDYVNGANLLLNDDLEAELLYGKGRSYGLELFVRKSVGKLNGWVSYTLSKTERQIDGLNRNQWYAAKYDRRHILSVVAIYEATKRWSFSANFSLSSGIAITFPNARYEFGGLIIPHNSNDVRNNYRVPAYHRLDISATWDRSKPNRKWAGSWVFSIYNLYSRDNAFSVYFRQNKDNPTKTEAVRLAIFGAMIPAVTYNFKF